MDKKAFAELIDELMRLYNSGDYPAALKAVEHKVDLFPEEEARTTFWRMCLLSLCCRPDDLLTLFRHGLDRGLWWAEIQFKLEHDFNAVRELPEFRRLVEESNKKCLEARARIKPDRNIFLPDAIRPGGYPLLIVLHGRSGNKESNLEHWGVACQRGWLVLSPQSTQPLYPNAYCWDDPEQGVQDILHHFNEVKKDYQIDQRQVVIGGGSQGGGMAIYAAFSRILSVRGFMGVGTWWFDVDALSIQVKSQMEIRGYFVTGERDPTLERARKIQSMLKANRIHFGEEIHPDVGHDYPPDFRKSFDKAIEFIFKE